jgi:hypothetical protein
MRKLALAAMTEDESGNDPAANLRFLAKHGYGLRPDSFTAAIRDDPWAAYDWLDHLTKSGHLRQAREQREEFIQLAGKEHPEVIESLARTTPEGALKRKMEDALFRSRLDVDPEGAIQEAMETKAPAVAVDRLSEAGKVLAASDPERAFELAKRMFDLCPDAFDNGIEIASGHSITNYGGVSNQGPEFAKALMAIDAGRVLDLAIAGNDNGTSSSTFSRLTGMWAVTDPAGLGEWAEGQADPVHDAAVYSLLMRQQEQGAFPKELDLAVRIRGSQRKDYIENILTRWNKVNPEATSAWLAGSGLPTAEIEALEKQLPAKPGS